MTDLGFLPGIGVCLYKKMVIRPIKVKLSTVDFASQVVAHHPVHRDLVNRDDIQANWPGHPRPSPIVCCHLTSFRKKETSTPKVDALPLGDVTGHLDASKYDYTIRSLPYILGVDIVRKLQVRNKVNLRGSHSFRNILHIIAYGRPPSFSRSDSISFPF